MAILLPGKKYQNSSPSVTKTWPLKKYNHRGIRDVTASNAANTMSQKIVAISMVWLIGLLKVKDMWYNTFYEKRNFVGTRFGGFS